MSQILDPRQKYIDQFTFYFVGIFHFFEIQSEFFLYLQINREFFN